MPPRILDVTANTTFDMLDARADAHEFTESGYAVLDVSIPRDSPDHVQLAIELDATDLGALTPHADRVELSAEQARTLANELGEYADALDAGEEPSRRRG